MMYRETQQGRYIKPKSSLLNSSIWEIQHMLSIEYFDWYMFGICHIETQEALNNNGIASPLVETNGKCFIINPMK